MVSYTWLKALLLKIHRHQRLVLEPTTTFFLYFFERVYIFQNILSVKRLSIKINLAELFHPLGSFDINSKCWSLSEEMKGFFFFFTLNPGKQGVKILLLLLKVEDYVVKQ